MLSLKQNNERLQRMVSGANTMPSDLSEAKSMDPLSDLIPTEEPPPDVEPDGKKIIISVYLGQPHSFGRYFIFNFVQYSFAILLDFRYYVEHYGNDGVSANATGEISIAHTSIGGSTSWLQLDNAVKRAFKQHVARLDPGGGLGLGKFSCNNK